MEAWLGDIEQRIAAREAEWDAERRLLTNRVEQFKSERDDADRKMEAIYQQSGGSSVHGNLVANLRAEIDQLHAQLEAARQAEAAAVKEADALRNRSPEELAREQIEEAIRAERLALAQERAALSRDRALWRRLDGPTDTE
jgi:hypothetical protein